MMESAVMMNRRRIGSYLVCDDEILGQGAFGEVKAAYPVTTSTTTTTTRTPWEKMAIKRLAKDQLSPTMLDHLKVEVDVLRRCRGHGGIVQLRDVVETETEAWFVMDYVNGGDLYDFVVSRHRLNETLARHIFVQLVDVVHRLHTRLLVIHHDIKLENVMLHWHPADTASADAGGDDLRRLEARLTDFGLCCTVQHANDLLVNFSGTESYCSPDILLGRPYSGGANDVYCLGVLFYICVTGSYPFDSDDLELQVRQQTNYGYLSALPFPSSVSRECRDLILTMLNPNARKRPTIEQVRDHPFFAPVLCSAVATPPTPTPAVAPAQQSCDADMSATHEEDETSVIAVEEGIFDFESDEDDDLVREWIQANLTNNTVDGEDASIFFADANDEWALQRYRNEDEDGDDAMALL